MLGYWIDGAYGAISVVVFSFVLYLISIKRISYNAASIFFSAFGITIVTLGYITSISVEDGLIYMIIPTIIIALLRPFREAVVWLVFYYSMFLMLNIMDIPNHPISVNVFVQLFSIHMVLFVIIGYFRRQENIMAKQLQSLNTQLQEEMKIDDLTGAYNRRGFTSLLDQALAKYSQEDQKFVLAIIDLDHFKRVNDNYGHQKGDEVLKALGHHFKSMISDTDTLIRYGGEEFIICFPQTELKKALKTMENIRRSVEELDLFEDDHMTISVGMTRIENEDTPTLLLSRADSALYEAKSSGRNKIVQK
jgi:diguanylate cyclase (GGDEF)-like protein